MSTLPEKHKDLPLLDVDGVLKKRNPKMYKLIPGFLLRYLKNIIHQEELNDFIIDNHHLEGVEFIEAAINRMNVTVKIIGEENLPVDGRHIFASNHPFGGLDGLCFIVILGNRYGSVRAIINDLLLNVKNMRPVFAGVNLYGSNTKDSIKKLEKDFASESPIMIFPAGIVSRKIKGKVQDLPWRKTFIAKAKQHKRDIVPAFIEGHNSRFFYNLSNFRKFIGIKTNFEMILLPHQMFLQWDNTVPFYFGKPIPYDFFDKRYRPDEWAAKVREYSYQLPNDHKTSFMEWLER